MKSVSAADAMNQLPAYLGEVARGQEAIVIENNGEPAAALISYEAYRECREIRERQRRREAMEDLRRLRAEVLARNADLTAEEADSLADELADEIMDRVLARARLRWEAQPH